MITIATAPITSIRLYCHSISHVTMIPIDTAHITSYDPSIVTTSTTSLRSPLLQHPSRHNDLYYYSNYHVNMTLIVTATITSQWSLLWQQLFRHYATRYYSTYCVTMILIATAYYATMIPISGKRPSCTHNRDWRTPARCAIPGAARRTPRQTSKTMPFVLSHCFYLPNWRP